ncbi:unnamed protein product [Linum trigynum]|uniref:Major facilitator superfamily (MFS) profile domain-containing protein n=1 Tax=Linum trigynum TaxID=586398 RepID=A0AAV2EVY2_9ROSI
MFVMRCFLLILALELALTITTLYVTEIANMRIHGHLLCSSLMTGPMVLLPQHTDHLALYRFFRNPQQPRLRLVISLLYLNIMQQLCGVELIVVFFVMSILPFRSHTLVGVLVSLIKISITLIPMATVDRIGRRPLLLASFVLITISSSVLGFIHPLEDEKDRWFMFLLIFGYTLGLGPVTTVYSSEVLPFRTRGQAISLGVSLNKLTRCILIDISPRMNYELKFSGLCILFAVINLLGTVYAYYVIHETKGSEALKEEGANQDQPSFVDEDQQQEVDCLVE